jgi:hypothetical protein
VTELERLSRITWAHTIEPEPVVWAWEDAHNGRIPAGSLSIGAGREGTGKSSFGVWLAAQITRGTLPGSYYGAPRRVLYVALEDSWKHTLVPRSIAAKANLELIGRFEVITKDLDGDKEMSVTLSLPTDNSLLQKAVTDNDVALVVIDPLLSVIGGHIDTHRNREVRDALDPLVRIADETGAVIYGIAHFNKSSGTDASTLITGSGAFKDVPRSVFGFARDNTDGSRIVTQTKNSLGRDDLVSRTYTIESAAIETPKGPTTTGRFVWVGETDRTVADVLRDNQHTGSGKQTAGDFIETYLKGAGGEAPANDVIGAGEAAGSKRQTLLNARRKVADTKSSGFKDKTHLWLVRDGSQETDVDTNVDTVHTTDQKVVPTVSTAVPTQPESTTAATDLEPPPTSGSPTPGSPTSTTPGLTDRVKQALDKARGQTP